MTIHIEQQDFRGLLHSKISFFSSTIQNILSTSKNHKKVTTMCLHNTNNVIVTICK